jgi:hypothetical protein
MALSWSLHLRRAANTTVPLVPVSVFVWIDGYWAWHGGRHVWIGGRWDRPPHGRRHWVAPRWEHRGHGYIFIEGCWR